MKYFYIGESICFERLKTAEFQREKENPRHETLKTNELINKRL